MNDARCPRCDFPLVDAECREAAQGRTCDDPMCARARIEALHCYECDTLWDRGRLGVPLAVPAVGPRLPGSGA